MKSTLPTLNLRPASARRDRGPNRSRQCRGFTLIEMLVVIGIIVVVLGIALPNMRGLHEGHELESAARQLVADLSLARSRAINNRATVVVAFIPPEILGYSDPAPDAESQIRQLQAGIFTQYALFTPHRVGDQPGCSTPRYLTRWVSLPDKTFIATNTFADGDPYAFFKVSLPFPAATNGVKPVRCVAFNFEGRPCQPDGSPLPTSQNITIPLARGGILYTRNPDSTVADFMAQETPAFNSVSNYHHIVIDWLSGQARLERQEVQ